MSTRKSIHRRSSAYSIQSQVSGVLNPDSNIASDEESAPLWFNDFENNSVNIRPSARFSLTQNESAVLDSNSELESTPLQKSWWKNLENTPDVRLSKANVPRERSNVQERSIVDTSETSLVEEGVAKQRFPLRRKKRKSLQKNVFSEILDASKDSIASQNSIQNPRNEDKQTTIDSSSDTDISIEKVKKPAFKNRKRTKLARKSTNFESKSDESLPQAFQHALDTSQSINETLGEATPSHEPGNSMENQDASPPGSPTSGESIRLELEPREQRIVSDGSEDTLIEDKDLEVPRSPVITSLPKKRTIFTKTTKTRTPNFDELLNDASEESLADQASITAELESNRDERREETIAQPPRKSDSARNMSVQTDETDSEESIKKQRVPLRRNKRQSHQEEIFEQLLESPNISVRSEPARTLQQTRKSELPRHKTLLSDVERRSSKRKSNLVETPVSPSFEVEENQSARKLRRLSSSTYKSGFGRQSMNKTKDHADISGSLNAELEENRSVSTQIRPSSIGKKSSAVRRSLIEKSDRAEISGISNFEVEENQSVRRPSRLSSVGNKSGTERHSTNKKTIERAESSGSSDAELEENRSISTLTHPSHIGDESDSEGRSKNYEEDRVEPSTSVNVEEEANRRSSVFKKPQDPSQNKKSLNQSQVNMGQSTTQAKYASFEVHNRSRSTKLTASTDEEEDEEELFENVEDLPSSSGLIDETQQNQDHSNTSRLPLRDASSAKNMEATIPLQTPNKNLVQSTTPSSRKSRSMVEQNLGKTVGSLQESHLIAASKTNRSYAADGIENIESSELRPSDTEGITQSATNRTQPSFSSVDHNGTESVQPANESLGIGSQVSHAEKLSQLKSALEKIKGKEIVLKKTTTIDSYFKKISPTKPAKHVAAKDPQKPLSKTKAVVNKSKNASAPPNKAYIVNGKVYKRPKLPRPKSWVTNRLYNYLWKKMEPKYHLRTRVRSEQFIVDLSQVVAIIVRRQKHDNYKEELNNLIHEMARLGIIETRKQFHTFCQNFLPYEFRIKVIPMLLPGNVRNIPFHPDKLHTPILKI